MSKLLGVFALLGASGSVYADEARDEIRLTVDTVKKNLAPPVDVKGTGIMPLPPPIQCDDMYVDNGIACIYFENDSERIVSDLKLGDVTSDNADFVVYPPETVGPEGIWFSFHTQAYWSNNTFVPWSTEIEYYGVDANGVTYVEVLHMSSSGGMIDFGLSYPKMFTGDVEVVYDPYWASGFALYDREKPN